MDEAGTWRGGRHQPRRLCVRWGPSPSPKRGGAPSPIFGIFLFWPNGCMDQDATLSDKIFKHWFLWTWNQVVRVKILVCTIHLAQMLDRTPKMLNFRWYHAVIFVRTLSSILVAPCGSITMYYIPAERHFLLMKVVSFTFSYDRATCFKILTKQLHPTFLCAIPNKLVKMLFAINITPQWISHTSLLYLREIYMKIPFIWYHS